MAGPEDSDAPQAGAGGAFPATRWSLVVTAREQDTPAAERALSELCELYWFPLYCFVRRKGHSPPDAEDLTQEFFRLVIERNYLGVADANRGKLRSFLLASIKNFMADSHKARKAQKRGGGKTIVSLDQQTAEDRYLVEPSHEHTPEAIFERRWAQTLLERIMQKLKAVYTDLGKSDHFDALHGFMEWNAGEGSYSEASAQLGISENNVRVSVFRMRKRFGELLRAQIAETVATPDDIAGELQHIHKVLQS